jgi:hypothetical protein
VLLKLLGPAQRADVHSAQSAVRGQLGNLLLEEKSGRKLQLVVPDVETPASS